MRTDRSFQGVGMSVYWDRKAAAFHAENPHVLPRLREIAIKAVVHGRTRLSINECFEVLRYEHGIETQGSEFKLNNNFRAWYARRLMATTPLLDGKFKIRGGAAAGIADGLASTFPDDGGDGDDSWITEPRRAA
jgi:hypothetical protein